MSRHVLIFNTTLFVRFQSMRKVQRNETHTWARPEIAVRHWVSIVMGLCGILLWSKNAIQGLRHPVTHNTTLELDVLSSMEESETILCKIP